ncbi:RCC1 domain-containing protein [Gryllotalpicola reticulitermitis]|uniref:RCC1 domain-containing protein n=1 Tax=Gryllotalpicola reticulitermitis TaxID=1184153 RepID=A0ABV8QD57_9MICO
MTGEDATYRAQARVQPDGGWVARVPSALGPGDYSVELEQSEGASEGSHHQQFGTHVLGHELFEWGEGGLDRRPVPAALKGESVVQVVGGDKFAAALTEEGRVVAWGGDQLAITAASLLDGIVKLAAGRRFGLALTADGRVRAWGDDSFGQTDIPADLRDVVEITARGASATAVTSTGRVVQWGERDDGPASVAAPRLTNTTVLGIAAGDQFDLALTADGHVECRGSNAHAQCDVPDDVQGRVRQMAGSSTTAYAITDDGRVRVWGQLDHGMSDIPAEFGNGAARAVQIDAGYRHALALSADGRVLAWGGKSWGQAVDPNLAGMVPAGVGASSNASFAIVNAVHISQPAPNSRTSAHPKIAGTAGPHVRLRVMADNNDDAAADVSASADGTWSLNSSQRLSTGAHHLSVSDDDGARADADFAVGPFSLSNCPSGLVSGAAPLLSGTASRGATVQIRLDGDRIASAAAQLDGGWVLRVPHALREGRHTTSAASDATEDGPPQSCSFDVAGYELVNWGDAALAATAPSHELAAATVVQVAGGDKIAAALTESGRVIAWGDASAINGVGRLRDVVEIAAGTKFGAALLADGTVQTWGNSEYGQDEVPAALKDVVQVAARGGFVLTLTSTGKVVSWGHDDYHQTEVPVDLDGRTSVQVAAGTAHAVALDANGEITAWGRSTQGQTKVPREVQGRVREVVAGTFSSYAITADNSVYGFGSRGNASDGIPEAWRDGSIKATQLGALYDGLVGLAPNGHIFTSMEESHGIDKVPGLDGAVVSGVFATSYHNAFALVDAIHIAAPDDDAEVPTRPALSGDVDHHLGCYGPGAGRGDDGCGRDLGVHPGSGTPSWSADNLRR